MKSMLLFGEQEEMETVSFEALCFRTSYVPMCILQIFHLCTSRFGHLSSFLEGSVPVILAAE